LEKWLMLIDKERCMCCEACYSYCPVGAIVTVEVDGEPVSEILWDECVECGVCLRAAVCPSDGIYMQELTWPRSIRAAFSDPAATHRTTLEPGRGTEEMKTNDVTGRYTAGAAGVTIEMGRPGVGTSVRDLETVAMAVAKLDVKFEPHNPVTALMTDTETGRIREDVLDERVLSAIIEFTIENERLKDVLETLKSVSPKLDTVYSLGVVNVVRPDGKIPAVPLATEAGFPPRPNMKINVGLGHR
jgi:Pyruvate/2-oxoacid:ferredoxin oxidoreductase delta subunit